MARPIRRLVDVDDLSDSEIEAVLARAEQFRSGVAPPVLTARALGLYFEEPSVRTMLGFKTAILRLGGGWAEIPPPYLEPGMSNRETVADVIRAVGSYVHGIAVRCGSVGALSEIVRCSPVPVVNAGAASEAHPTQALIDLYAIRRRFGSVDGLKIGLVGDLARSRAARSLMKLLARARPAEVRLMHPAGERALSLPGRSVDESVWRDVGTRLALDGLDVVYVAGFPAGSGALADDPARRALRKALTLTADAASSLKGGALILCPMPRIDEIAGELDDHPAMGMFDASADGLWVRMAVVEGMLAE